jgi:hypothetical protein
MAKREPPMTARRMCRCSKRSQRRFGEFSASAKPDDVIKKALAPGHAFLVLDRVRSVLGAFRLAEASVHVTSQTSENATTPFPRRWTRSLLAPAISSPDVCAGCR